MVIRLVSVADSRRFVKKQQMQWTLRGAHLLLQTRTRVLNEDLDDLFRRWLSKIQVATTNAGARAEGGLTPNFLALSYFEAGAQEAWTCDQDGTLEFHFSTPPEVRRASEICPKFPSVIRFSGE